MVLILFCLCNAIHMTKKPQTSKINFFIIFIKHQLDIFRDCYTFGFKYSLFFRTVKYMNKFIPRHKTLAQAKQIF